MSLKNVFIVSLTTSSSRFQDQRLLLLPIWQQHNSAWISHQVAKAQYSTRGLFTTGYVALHLWLFRSKAMSTELLHYKQTAEVLRRNARGKRQSFIVNINKNNKETQTTRPMVRKTEFMAPLCVCISIAQVNPNMLSCSISRPCSSVAQGYSVRSLLNQHICTLTMKIMCNHNFVCAPSESTLLTLTWRAWRDSIYFPPSYFTVCMKSHQHQNHRTSKGEMLSWQKMYSWPSFCSTRQVPHTKANPSSNAVTKPKHSQLE